MTITVDRLRLRACHGVLEQERALGNVYEVTVSLTYPPALAAAESDDLSATINYAEVVEIVKRQMAEPSRLLEHVCGRMRRALMLKYPAVTKGKVTVTKLLPPIAGAQLAGASATLSWGLKKGDNCFKRLIFCIN